MRRQNGPVNTAVVCAGARGMLNSMDATRLAEHGGQATLGRGWAMSLLKRMNFTKRMGTTQAKITPQDFEQLQMQFLQDIVDVVEMEYIPARLMFNWDQTDLNLVPSSSWTMEKRGQKESN